MEGPARKVRKSLVLDPWDKDNLDVQLFQEQLNDAQVSFTWACFRATLLSNVFFFCNKYHFIVTDFWGESADELVFSDPPRYWRGGWAAFGLGGSRVVFWKSSSPLYQPSNAEGFLFNQSRETCTGILNLNLFFFLNDLLRPSPSLAFGFRVSN